MSASSDVLPWRFTDRRGVELFAASARGLRLAFDLSRLDGTDGNIAFRSATDPGHRAADHALHAFAGTKVKWFYHQPVGTRPQPAQGDSPARSP